MSMNISFQWGDDTITHERKGKIEKDILIEIPDFLERFPNPPTEILVHLFPDRPRLSLEGTATNTDGITLIKFTYAVHHPCMRSYYYLGVSHSDER